jgi:hypothetical protein
MKVLVLTSEPITAQQLRETLPGDLRPQEVEVMVVAPALHESPIKFWFSDADDAIARADEVSHDTVEQLGRAGVAAGGDTGESDPLEAIQDALATFPADRIILFTHKADSTRYREDIDPDDVRERFGVAVDRATVSSSAG